MDMTKYLGAAFLKIDDVKAAGPLQVKIVDIEEGQFDRPVASFDDGTRLTLNVGNTRILARAYGIDSDGWVGKQIQLELGSVEYQGAMQDSIVVVPISEAIPIEQRPKPKPGTGSKKGRVADMDDEIAF